METNEKETAENKTQKKKWLKRKIGDTLPVLYVKAFLLMLLGQYIGLFITNGVIFALNAVDPSISQSDAWLTGELYFLFIGIWLIVLLALVIFKKNRPILACVGPKAKGNNLTQLAIGLALGFGMNAFCILIAWLNKDISLYFDSFKPVSFIFYFHTGIHTVVSRGAFMQMLFVSKADTKLQKPIGCHHWQFHAFWTTTFGKSRNYSLVSY